VKVEVPENIKSIVPYPPGKPIEELEREYGVKDSIKLASNENAWGSSPKAIQAIKESLSKLNRYPDGSNYYLVQAIAEKTGFSPDEVIVGNGSDEIIEFLVKAYVQNGDEVITSHPSFLMYQKVVQVRGGVNKIFPLKGMHHDLEAILASITDRTRLIFLDNPNNPTATAINPGELYTFLSKVPESVIVVLDEAYVDFMDSEVQVDVYSLVHNSKGRCGVVALRTFSKAYGMAGARIGYGMANTDLISAFNKIRNHFGVNRLAQAGALAALADQDWLNQTREKVTAAKKRIGEIAEENGFAALDSATNFVAIDLGKDGEYAKTLELINANLLPVIEKELLCGKKQ